MEELGRRVAQLLPRQSSRSAMAAPTSSVDDSAANAYNSDQRVGAHRTPKQALTTSDWDCPEFVTL